MTKHTPGPWEPSLGQISPDSIWSGDDKQICRLGDLDEQEANARLIAAAPDLLAACEKLLAAYDEARAQGHGEILMAEARAAIDKARGTTPHD